jgi:hypothetical protein
MVRFITLFLVAALVSCIALAAPALSEVASAQSAGTYVPSPASNYGLLAADVGLGFREVEREDSADGSKFRTRIVAPDAVPYSNIWISLTNISYIDTTVLVFPTGSNDAVTAGYNQALDVWRARLLNVQPTVGWGSEQVYSFATNAYTPDRVEVMGRGIALKHRNALVVMEMVGLAQHTTWDNNARLMRLVEQRIHGAAR